MPWSKKTGEDYQKFIASHADSKEYSLESLKKFIELDPLDADRFALRAFCSCLKILSGELSIDKLAPIEDCTRAIELDPGNPDRYDLRQNLYIQLGPENFLQLALSDCDKAIELDPENSKRYYSRSDVYLKMYKNTQLIDYFQLALSDCSKAIELDPENGELYYSRSHAYLEGDLTINDYLEMALSDCNKAIEIDPNCIKYYLGHGDRYFFGYNRNNNNILLKYYANIAISNCSKLIEIDPKNKIAYEVNKVAATFFLGDKELALSHCDQAISLYPRVADLHFFRYLCLREIKNSEDEALKELDNAIKISKCIHFFYRVVFYFYCTVYKNNKTMKNIKKL